MKKFSIIIPTYNSEKTLAVCLESIVNQNFNDVEIFVMDGLSQDTTVTIANDFKKVLPGLIVISEKDKGIYDAMNKGMERASGEWILFLGSDDTLFDSAVLQTVKMAIDTTNAKVVYGNAKIIGDTGWAKDGDIYDGAFTTAKLLYTNICHQAIFYNRKFVKKEIGGFNLKYNINADWDFNLRCWSKKSFEYLDLVIANFSAGGVSSNSKDLAMAVDFVTNVCTYFKIDPFHPLVNNPKFAFYPDAVKLQKSKYLLRYTGLEIKRRILLNLKSYFGTY